VLVQIKFDNSLYLWIFQKIFYNTIQVIMAEIIKAKIFYTFSFLILVICSPGLTSAMEVPVIKAGTSKITGSISTVGGTNKDSILVTIGVPHPISGEYVRYNVLVNQAGSFSIDVDVETTTSLLSITSSLNPYKSFYVKISSGTATHIDLAYTAALDLKNIQVSPAGLTRNDMTRGIAVVYEMISYRPDRAPEKMFAKPPAYFLKHAKKVVSERLKILDQDTLISKNLKDVLSRDFRLLMYNTHVFDYEGEMKNSFQNTADDKNKQPDIQNIDVSYFGFLREFNLQDPQYLYCSTFSEFQKTILQNEKIGLPIIGDTDIPSWLVKVKAILSPLTGFNEGQYYDVLAANAYGRQLNEKGMPLTIKQRNNIARYWKKGEIAKILLRKNKQVVDSNKGKSPAVVNEISSVPDEQVMNTIVSKYKNKVVLVDLWATWCAPCLDAMRQFESTKAEFLHQDVVFVYVTNSSSPRRLWAEKIEGIGNEHYYLTDSQWAYMMNHFGFEGIPSYLLFNKSGGLVNQFTAFPGSEKVKEMLNGLL